MTFDMVKDVISILLGITTIVLNLKQLTSGQSSASISTNIIFNLMVAMGVLLIIYGGWRFNSIYAATSSERIACQRAYSFDAVETCRDRVDDEYNEDVKPSLGYIGAGFIIIALGSFVRNFKTASWMEYVVELGLLILGVLLVLSNF